MSFVYMIRDDAGSLYVGVTNDPEKRLHYHNHKRGSEFTKVRGDFAIVFLEEHPTLAHARKREIQIKKWRRDKKDMLIERYTAGLPTQLRL